MLCLGTALLLVSAVTGCDPRLPYVRPQEELVSVPPTIDLASVFPPPGTLPVEVLLGNDCISENTFSVNRVIDTDLPDEGVLQFRWRIIAQTGDAQTATAGVLPGLVRNTSGAVGAELSIVPFEMTEERLQGEFFTAVDEMIGRTHRIEVRVTDGEFVPEDASIDLVDPAAGSAFFYWLFTLDDQPCG